MNTTIRMLEKYAKNTKISFLDLRRSGISILDRLVLEEALLRHDPLQRCWAIVGIHDPTYNRLVSLSSAPSSGSSYTNTFDANKNCSIVLGLGGKPKELLNLDKIRQDGILCIKRFSGGGTVVVDHSSLFTTFIGRTNKNPEASSSIDVDPYPRELMQWTADVIFDGVFASMNSELIRNNGKMKERKSLVVDTKSCGFENSGETVLFPSNGRSTDIHSSSHLPTFSLRENDYVFGHQKMGGSAQSIIKGGWLHHTSFLWDYESHHMEYLTIPSKRPEYRGDRNHNEFLVKLKSHYDSLSKDGKFLFFDHVRDTANKSFVVEDVSLEEALQLVDDELGGMQNWFEGKCRTRVLDEETLFSKH